MEKRKLNNEGFSLIELIVVIAIMAILVGSLAPQFLKYIERTNVATDLQNVSQLKTAVEVYVADCAASGSSVSSDITITIASGSPSMTVTVAGGGLTAANVQTQLGISSLTTNLKSKNWPSAGVTYTYSSSTNTWGTPTSYINSSNNADMKTVF